MKLKTFFKKVVKKLRGGVITLYPKSAPCGRVLLSYKTDPFFDSEKKDHLHTNMWECREITRMFLSLGYVVDVMDWFNHGYKPKKEYQYFVDLGTNLERIGPLLNKDCLKIFYATTSHWLFNNQAENERLLELQKRRRVTLKPRRSLLPARNIEEADFSACLGNEATLSTYAFAGKKMHQLPISTTHIYPFPENKDLAKAKTNFVWLGGAGMVHKGLDLVLEAFAQLPDYQLFVCGDVAKEKDFESLYWPELYQTSNIKTLGRVDLGGEIFKQVASGAIALIHPSCSEGQSGAVVTGMHAGLIPLVSYHSGVEVVDFGVIIKDGGVREIIEVVKQVGDMSPSELKRRSRDSWEYARSNHTREKFAEAFANFVIMMENEN